MTREKKFFIPKAKDDAQAEEVWESVKKFAEDTLDWEVSDRRIFSIAYQKRGKDYYVEGFRLNNDTGFRLVSDF